MPEDEVIASTRKGKQVLNVDEPEEARVCVPVEGDHVATIGENRKMLIFTLDEVNEMTRGKGVILQRFKDGGLSDVRVFKKSDGLTWLDSAGRTFTLSWTELKDWVGERAQGGPHRAQGFPTIQFLRPRVTKSRSACTERTFTMNLLPPLLTRSDMSGGTRRPSDALGNYWFGRPIISRPRLSPLVAWSSISPFGAGCAVR